MPALAQVPAQPTEFIWQSRNESKAQVQDEFNTFYRDLRSFRDRAVTPLIKEVPVAGEFDAFLRAQNVFAGDAVPPELRRYVCELNGLPANCASLEGKTRALVPDLKFDEASDIVAYTKKPGQKLRDIVVGELGGCKSYDNDCRSFVLILNGDDKRILADTFGGTLSLPVTAYRTQLRLVRAAPRPTSAQIEQMARPAALGPVPAVTLDFSFQRRTVPLVPLRQQSNGSAGGRPTTLEEMKRNRAEVLALVGHPLSNKASIKNDYVVYLGVIDGWIDIKHCDFNEKSFFYVASLPISDEKYRWKPPSDGAAPPCGALTPAAVPLQDHGTHVLGIVASRPDSKIGPGVHPDPFLVYIEGIERDADALSLNDRFKYYLSNPNRKPLDVVNFSFTYPVNVAEGSAEPVSDALERTIRALHRTIFVAAAGNDTRGMNAGTCHVSPACFHKQANVISVVAISKDPDDPKLATDPGSGYKSNSGTDFSLSAPGENVASTVSNNQVGLLTGTSQAAPLVAGAASLLRAKCQAMPPIVVKNRLIYSSDLVGSIDRFALGGRLNIGRALRYERPEIVEQGVATPATGWTLAFPTELEALDIATGLPNRLATSRIKRMTLAPDGTYWAFLLSANGCDPAIPLEGCPLERKKVRFVERKTLVFSKPQSATTKNIDTGALLDYTAAIPPSHGCQESDL